MAGHKQHPLWRILSNWRNTAPMPRHLEPTPPARIVTPPFDFRTRLQREAPSFLGRLENRRTIAGWSANPYQRPTTADARAAAIADRWIKRFNDTIGDYGFLTLTGVEVNTFLTVTNKQAVDNTILSDRIRELYGVMKDILSEKHDHTDMIDKKLAVQGNPLFGRVYPDNSDELEIATPAMSPMATISRVNRVKRQLFEATHDYWKTFATSADGKANPNAEVPSSPGAKLLAEGLAPFNIGYSDPRAGPTGEHFNISFIRRGHVDPLGYHNVKRDVHRLVTNNLFAYRSPWMDLFAKAYENYLPGDSMLAYGGKNSFNSYYNVDPSKKQKHRVSRHPNGSETDAETRLEIRSFNNASSNISLTTLAIVAISYAVMKTIHDDPQLKHKYMDKQEPLSTVDALTIEKKLSERIAPNYHVPFSDQVAAQRFQSSLTLYMMQEYIQDAPVSREEKKEMQEDIALFRQAIMQRPKQLTGELIEGTSVSR